MRINRSYEVAVDAEVDNYIRNELSHMVHSGINPKDMERALTEDNIDRVMYQKSFGMFIPEAWKTFDAATFISNWHIDCIAEYMEAVFHRHIMNLVINIPPRCMKSSVISVAFPAWGWANDASLNFMCLSYAEKLSLRDSVKCRRLIESPWYQRLWGKDSPASWSNKVILAPDQNQKGRYENTAKGTRLSSSVGGTITGEGADFILMDDPHNVFDAESDTIRESVIQWWDEAIPSRLNTAKGCKVIIQQRVHERDLAGVALETGEYEHLVLPAEYDPKHKYVFMGRDDIPDWAERYKYIFRGDIRKEPGELLWEKHLPEYKLNNLRKQMGEYAYANQYQQLPAPREGGMFKAEWFKIIEPKDVPSGGFIVRAWDLAATEGSVKHADRTVGVKMKGFKTEDRYVFIVLDVKYFSLDAGSTDIEVASIVETDGCFVDVQDFPQDPGQSGKQQRRYLTNRLIGSPLLFSMESGNKVSRARVYSAQAGVGNVYLVRDIWNKDYIDEHASFPNGRYDDMVDASSRAIHRLIRMITNQNSNVGAVSIKSGTQPGTVPRSFVVTDYSTYDGQIADTSLTSDLPKVVSKIERTGTRKHKLTPLEVI